MSGRPRPPRRGGSRDHDDDESGCPNARDTCIPGLRGTSAQKRQRVRFAPPANAALLATIASRSGYLRKQADNEPGKWTRYFFVLKPSTYLYYYNTEGDTEPRGIMDLEFLQDVRLNVECLQRSVGGSEHAFRVTGQLPAAFSEKSEKTKFRPVYLDTETREEAEAWMDAILSHRFDPQQDEEYTQLVKSMEIADERLTALEVYSQSIASETKGLLRKGREYISKLRGVDCHSDDDDAWASTKSAEERISMALQRLDNVLDEMYAEADQQSRLIVQLRKHEGELRDRESDYKKREAVFKTQEKECKQMEKRVQQQQREIDQQQRELQKQDEEMKKILDDCRIRETELDKKQREMDRQQRELDRKLRDFDRDTDRRQKDIEKDADRRQKEAEKEFEKRHKELERDADRRQRELDKRQRDIDKKLKDIEKKERQLAKKSKSSLSLSAILSKSDARKSESVVAPGGRERRSQDGFRDSWASDNCSVISERPSHEEEGKHEVISIDEPSACPPSPKILLSVTSSKPSDRTKSDATIVTESTLAGSQDPKPQITSMKMEVPQQKSSSQRGDDAIEVEQSLTPKHLNEVLVCPKGWTKRESRSRPGEFYYVHDVTGETSWEVPRGVANENSRCSSIVAPNTPHHQVCLSIPHEDSDSAPDVQTETCFQDLTECLKPSAEFREPSIELRKPSVEIQEPSAETQEPDVGDGDCCIRSPGPGSPRPSYLDSANPFTESALFADESIDDSAFGVIENSVAASPRLSPPSTPRDSDDLAFSVEDAMFPSPSHANPSFSVDDISTDNVRFPLSPSPTNGCIKMGGNTNLHQPRSPSASAIPSPDSCAQRSPTRNTMFSQYSEPHDDEAFYPPSPSPVSTSSIVPDDNDPHEDEEAEVHQKKGKKMKLWKGKFPKLSKKSKKKKGSDSPEAEDGFGSARSNDTTNSSRHSSEQELTGDELGESALVVKDNKKSGKLWKRKLKLPKKPFGKNRKTLAVTSPPPESPPAFDFAENECIELEDGRCEF